VKFSRETIFIRCIFHGFSKMIVIYIQLLVLSFASDFGLPQMRARLYPPSTAACTIYTLNDDFINESADACNFKAIRHIECLRLAKHFLITLD